MNKDCFAYLNNGCVALNSVLCDKSKCPFYKTHAQIQRDYNKAVERKNRLGLTMEIVNANNIK